ncbi:hypothetical protein KFE25_005509 [Diacronema lutheri]|uniref:Uncharacterized protein n=1 Tax=Diacronema lutheri TaxID=2081491 RepID=A0A8J6CAW5_DIALT|nr:hypothetical protein KFE25_005509 [Diacronema lutheri]
MGTGNARGSSAVTRRELVAARLLPLLACSTLAPPEAYGAPRPKGAAELDAGYYLKALLRGPEANRDDEFFSSPGARLAESALGPPDAHVARAVLDGALDALAHASGRPLDDVRELAARVSAGLRPNELLVESGTPTYAFVRDLSAVCRTAAPLLRAPRARDAFGTRFGCAVLGALAAVDAPAAPAAPRAARPPSVDAAERALARLRGARLLVGWTWLDAGALTPLDAEQFADLADLDRAREPWSIALEWRGSPTIAPASVLAGSQAAELLPEPVAAAVAAAIRADACTTGDDAELTPAGGENARRAAQWDLLFLEDYRETTRIDVTKLSALMQLSVTAVDRL